MDKDRIEGAGKQVKGAIKDAAGKVTGDATLQAEGYVESRHGSGTFIAGDLTGLASRRRGAMHRTKRAVPTTAQIFCDFERSAAQSDALFFR